MLFTSKINLKYRSSHERCSIKNMFLKISQKFTGKHLCQSLFLIKLQASSCNFIKKRLWQRCFLVNFVKFLRMAFLQNSFGRLLLKTSIYKYLQFWIPAIQNHIGKAVKQKCWEITWIFLTHFSPVVLFCIETSHLICTA